MKLRTFFLKNVFYLVLFALFVLGCHEDYVNINIDFKPGRYNAKKTEIAFIRFLQIGQPPSGTSRFPDGGKTKILHKDVSLYHFNLQTNELKSIFSYSDLPFSKSRWKEDLSFQNNLVAFSMRPVSGWQWEEKNNTDSQFKKYIEAFSGIFIYNIFENITTRITTTGCIPSVAPDEKKMVFLNPAGLDSVELWIINLNSGTRQKLKTFKNIRAGSVKFFWQTNDTFYYMVEKEMFNINLHSKKVSKAPYIQFKDNYKISTGAIKAIAKHIPFGMWGIHLGTLWPQNKAKYLNDIVILNGNLNYRKAIIEEMAGDLKREDIENLLGKMVKHRDSLSGYEKTKYEINSKETIDLLKNLRER